MITSTPSPRDAFIEHLNVQIAAHLSDPTLDVRRLLRLIGMSRTDLHRKLKTATGMSTTAYIRYIRLQQAASMLKEQREWSLYQIALEVGFSSQSYFTRKFKEQFCMCPLAFRMAQQNTFQHLEHL